MSRIMTSICNASAIPLLTIGRYRDCIAIRAYEGGNRSTVTVSVDEAKALRRQLSKSIREASASEVPE
jgi:hypothetical protein